jgi:uncharacterized repeat protein (TIGR01451 family)
LPSVAASWGQYPFASRGLPNQPISLDLGTTVLPFANLRVTKVVDKEFVSPGESLIYTIRVYNLGQSAIKAMQIRLFDTLDPWVEYVPGTTTAANASNPLAVVRPISDNSVGTKFPLDETGFLIPLILDRRGGMIDVSFEVKLKSGVDIAMKAENIINTGTMREPTGSTQPFDAISKVVYKPNITISNTVYIGSDVGGSGCPSALEQVTGASGTSAVYCFNITNTGSTYLTNVTLNDQVLAFSRAGIKMLAPGESVIIPLLSKILSNLTNNATAIGNPAFANGTDIPDLSDVNATDPSSVGLFTANISLTNTVYLGSDAAGSGCSSAVEYVEGPKNTDVVYCFNITNTGNTYLGSITLSDGSLAFNTSAIKTLAPGESVLVPLKSSVLTNLTNVATVSGNPVNANGIDIPNMPDVNATDPSSVGLLTANISLTNTVYLGSDAAGSGCSSAVEYVEGPKNTDVVYCFNITNTGNTYLGSITLSDSSLAFNTSAIKTLAPGESVLVPLKSSVLTNLTNVATVSGNPVNANGFDIPNMPDVNATDPSSVGLFTANISLTNMVYLGSDAAGSGCSSAVEYVEGLKNTDVVYCFNITNTGNTYLGSITLSDGSLAFNTSAIKTLAPGESVLVPFKSNILVNLTNIATVSGNPVNANGADIPKMPDVTASDPSAVGKLRETPRDPPYSPPGNETKCLQDSWNETYSTGSELICTTKEVYLLSLKSQPITCILGEMVNVSVTAAINIASSRSDLGWYVAADGGDALEGKCIVNGLQEMFDYTITNTTTGGQVTYDDDACGDVTISGQGGGTLEIPVVVNSAVLCADENDDGLLDMAVCFTWNTKATDSICTLSSSDPATKGVLPDLYPGAASMCYCESYNIPNTTVVKPVDDPVPCK